MKICDDLRQAVLQAAIQGKLTTQRKEDGDARELLKQIAAEKEELIASGKYKKDKLLEPIKSEEQPYNLPENWIYERLGNLGFYKKGPFGSALTKSMFVPKSSNAIKVYEQKNAIQKDSNLGDYFITREYYESKMESFTVYPGDIIVSCAGTIGETYVMPQNCDVGIINQALMRIKLVNCIDIKFYLLFFDFVIKQNANEKSKGSAIKNIPPFEIFKNMLIPLPPLAEQQRIVVKVEKLMAEIDELEKVENELNALKTVFPGDMKAALLQAAMQGKLTTQRKEDGDARDLLKQIAKEKAKLIKDKKIKNEKLLPEIAEDEIPFDVPENWVWVKLGDLTIKDIKRGKSPVYTNKSSVMVFAQKCNVKAGGINMLLAQYLDETRLEKYHESEFLLNNDIVINSTGTGTMGRVGLFKDTDRIDEMRIVPDSHVTVIRASNLINPKYLYYYLYKSQSIFEENGDGSTNQKELKAKYLNSFCVPLPPLAEQQRIVAKLDRLLPLCDGLAEKELEKLLD